MNRYVIGRSGDNDIVVDDSSVSRVHAELRATGKGALRLIDRNSTFGTGVFRNGHWIQIHQCIVEPGDRIRLGDFVTSADQLLAMVKRPAPCAPAAAAQPKTKRNRAPGRLPKQRRPAARGGEHTMVLTPPKTKAWVVAGSACGVVLVIAIAAILLFVKPVGARQEFVDRCISAAKAPRECRCIGEVLAANFDEDDFQAFLDSYRNSALPRPEVAKKLVRLGPKLMACEK